MEACEEALNRRTSPIIPTSYAMKMIETVLDNNNLSVGEGKHYQQKEGVAIGSRLGKNFACVYMRKWDEELLKCGQTTLFYKRFIDDGFGIW